MQTAMKRCAWVAAALAAWAAMPAQAINKCINEWGRPVFQDAPCPGGRGGEIDVRPASGAAKKAEAPRPADAGGGAAAASAAAAPAAMTEAQRIEANIAKSQRERRGRELETIFIPQKRQEIEQYRQGCEAQLAELRDRKKSANNNLAGATWENSLSSEMIAVSTQCDTKMRSMRDDLEAMRSECRALGGCK